MTHETDLFLPEDYRTNPPASADRDGNPYWERGRDHNDVRFQVPVYRLASKRARDLSPRLVMDIGCGSGDKLAEFFGNATYRIVGVDQESAIQLVDRHAKIEWVAGDLDSDQFWSNLAAYEPDLVICSDVIEHLVDPRGLLERLRCLTGDGLLILSTPDRAMFDDQAGPPGNPRHIREWTNAELRRLAEASGFDVVASHHLLPRRYSWTIAELRRIIGRARRAMAIPDRRTCQALELRPR